MKRLMTAAIALSLLGGSAVSTAAMAQPYRHDDRGHHAMGGHHWTRGQRLPPQYRTRAHYIDYRRHHLRPPPRGYQWVQVDNDYALVALTSGLISSIIAAGR